MNQKELFWISLTVFLTIFAWMILDLYKAKTAVKVDSGLESVQKVDYVIQSDVLPVLKQKNP